MSHDESFAGMKCEFDEGGEVVQVGDVSGTAVASKPNEQLP